MGGLGSRVVPEKVSPAWSPFDEQIITERTPLITFGTPVDPDLTATADTVCEWTIEPTAFAPGDGQSLFTTIITASGTGSNAAGSASIPGLSVPIARRQPVILVARAITGTTDILAGIRSLEEW